MPNIRIEDIEMVRDLMRELVNSAEVKDGLITINTLGWEALERAWHNIDPSYLPDHPDSSTSVACRHNFCEYCQRHDYATQGAQKR